jgi:hypothetical protein
MFKDDLRVAIFTNSTIVKLETFARGLSFDVGHLVSEVLWWGAVIAIALVFAGYSAPSIQITNPRCGVLALLDGSGYKPYAYRVLTTWLLQAMAGIGLSVTDGMFTIVGTSLVGCVVAFRYLISSFDGYRARSAVIAPLLVVVIAALQVSFPYTMVYDMPTLALFIMSYALMTRQRWSWYMVAFALACLSKETSALLVIGFAAMYLRKMSWRNYIALGAAQFVIWCAVHGGLAWLFRDAPGAEMETYWAQHLIAVQRLPLVIVIYGALVIALLVAIFNKWKSKPVALRWLFVSIAPIIGALYVVGGTPFELRVFFEIAPIALVLCFVPAGAEAGVFPASLLTSPRGGDELTTQHAPQPD